MSRTGYKFTYIYTINNVRVFDIKDGDYKLRPVNYIILKQTKKN